MRQALMRSLLAGTAGVAFTAALLFGEPAVTTQELQAVDIQFFVTTVGDGWKCESCCVTGYCCSVPINSCEPQQT